MLPLSVAWTHEEGLPSEIGIPGFWDITVPVSSRTGEDTLCSSTGQERIHYVPPQHGTGQRGQSQFQGATLAPPISQASPRG